jgi:hypothetical protein
MSKVWVNQDYTCAAEPSRHIVAAGAGRMKARDMTHLMISLQTFRASVLGGKNSRPMI